MLSWGWITANSATYSPCSIAAHKRLRPSSTRRLRDHQGCWGESVGGKSRLRHPPIVYKERWGTNRLTPRQICCSPIHLRSSNERSCPAAPYNSLITRRL